MKVGWILIGDRNTPSSRIMGMNVSDWMNKNGIDSKINGPNDALMDYDTIIFQKIFDADAQRIAKYWKEKWHKQIIYVIDDLYGEGLPMAQIADKVVCGSDYIREWIRPYTQAKLYTIDDAYETPRALHKTNYKTDKVKVLWFGTLLHWPQAEQIRPLVEDLGYEYVTITAHPQATKQWSLDTIWQDIIDSDIVIIPYLGALPPYELAKGNNRLTQSMVLGLPCIVSPIPAYIPIIRQGRTGYICYDNNTIDWTTYLRLLVGADTRERIGTMARNDVVDKYSIDSIGKRWLEILND
jgi:hypothetical protein